MFEYKVEISPVKKYKYMLVLRIVSGAAIGIGVLLVAGLLK